MLAHCSVGNIKKFFKIIFKTSMKWDGDEGNISSTPSGIEIGLFLRTNWNVILGSAM